MCDDEKASTGVESVAPSQFEDVKAQCGESLQRSEDSVETDLVEADDARAVAVSTSPLLPTTVVDSEWNLGANLEKASTGDESVDPSQFENVKAQCGESLQRSEDSVETELVEADHTRAVSVSPSPLLPTTDVDSEWNLGANLAGEILGDGEKASTGVESVAPSQQFEDVKAPRGESLQRSEDSVKTEFVEADDARAVAVSPSPLLQTTDEDFYWNFDANLGSEFGDERLNTLYELSLVEDSQKIWSSYPVFLRQKGVQDSPRFFCTVCGVDIPSESVRLREHLDGEEHKTRLANTKLARETLAGCVTKFDLKPIFSVLNHPSASVGSSQEPKKKRFVPRRVGNTVIEDLALADQVSQLSSALQSSNSPSIGLEYIVEVVDDSGDSSFSQSSSLPPKFVCLLCQQESYVSNVAIQHVHSFAHTLRYFQLHCPKAFLKLSCSPPQQQCSPKAVHVLRLIIQRLAEHSKPPNPHIVPRNVWHERLLELAQEILDQNASHRLEEPAELTFHDLPNPFSDLRRVNESTPLTPTRFVPATIRIESERFSSMAFDHVSTDVPVTEVTTGSGDKDEASHREPNSQNLTQHQNNEDGMKDVPIPTLGSLKRIKADIKSQLAALKRDRESADQGGGKKAEESKDEVILLEQQDAKRSRSSARSSHSRSLTRSCSKSRLRSRSRSRSKAKSRSRSRLRYRARSRSRSRSLSRSRSRSSSRYRRHGRARRSRSPSSDRRGRRYRTSSASSTSSSPSRSRYSRTRTRLQPSSRSRSPRPTFKARSSYRRTPRRSQTPPTVVRQRDHQLQLRRDFSNDEERRACDHQSTASSRRAWPYSLDTDQDGALAKRTVSGAVPPAVPSASIQERWNTMNRELSQVLQSIGKRRMFFTRHPESHPSYATEWQQFWAAKHRLLRAEGKNANDYNYTPEWIAHWERKLSVLDDEYIKEEKERLKMKYRLTSPLSTTTSTQVAATSSTRDAPVPLERSPIKMRWKSIPEVSSNGSNVEKKAAATRSPEMESVSSEEETPTNRDRRKSMPEAKSEKKVEFLAVLRVLAVLEEGLGSSGPLVNALLSKALALERTQGTGGATGLINDAETIDLLDTAKERLKGSLEAGMLEHGKAKAAQKVINDVGLLLKQAMALPTKASGRRDVRSGTTGSSFETRSPSLRKEDNLQSIVTSLLPKSTSPAQIAAMVQGLNTLLPTVQQSSKPLQREVIEATVPRSSLQSMFSEGVMHIEVGSRPLEELTADELRALVLNCRKLSAARQNELVSYLRRLEFTQPERFRALRRYIASTAPPSQVPASPLSPGTGSSVNFDLDPRLRLPRNGNAMNATMSVEPPAGWAVPGHSQQLHLPAARHYPYQQSHQHYPSAESHPNQAYFPSVSREHDGTRNLTGTCYNAGDPSQGRLPTRSEYSVPSRPVPDLPPAVNQSPASNHPQQPHCGYPRQFGYYLNYK